MRATTKAEAERVGKYMIRPLLSKVRKASLEAAPLRIVEEELQRIPSKGWAA